MLKSLDLRTKTTLELATQLKELVKQLRETSLAVISQKQTNIGLPRKIRKDIARVKSILAEKEVLKDVDAVASK